MISILKTKPLLLFSTILIIILTACNSNELEKATENQESQKFVYIDAGCCMNFKSVEEIELVEICKPNYGFFYALNLDEFNISQNYSIGDTLLITFDFGAVCEASGAEYNCVIECDIRHGVPIQIISVD